MFITKEELQTAIYEYQLADITGMDVNDIAVRHAGDARHPLLVEHVKSIAVWYIIKRANTDIIFDRAKEYYKAAIDWLKLVAGVGTDDETIAPDLPLRRTEGEEGGSVATPFRFGSHPKFDNGLDDMSFNYRLRGLNHD